YTLAHIGWCYYELADNPTALRYLERSWQLRNYSNQLAADYLPLVRKRLQTQAPEAVKP
ncbi:MAG: hypothetical protein K0Q55_1133, partial [Verrucomicrobia bacterium]|nr:hypothetical protein [Verrucomicrobiota bacterium]